MDTSSIGSIQDGIYHLRDNKITTLMETGDWLGTIALALVGRSLEAHERPLISACLIASIDHGMAPPSAQVTRIIASSGKPLADSVAGGMLTFGPRHGNAASAASQWLRERVAEGQDIKETVRLALEKGGRLMGFGHPEYEIDPRAQTLATLVRAHMPAYPHMEYALRVAEELTIQKGKPLPLNVDGAIGAVIADLGWPAELADALFLISRTIGLSAHALEEIATAKTYRRK